MPSEGALTVPRMGSFKRSLLGYRRPEVETAISARETRIRDLELDLGRCEETRAELESEMASLSGMVIEREREIRGLVERLGEANECHDRSIASLEVVTSRLQELESQARGQATRIRMKALREAVEVSKRVKALTDVELEEAAAPAAESNGNGALYEGQVKLEIGPLGDFSQLVGFEDAVARLGASEVSVERFSEGRATFSMRLDHPVDLLHELEERSLLDFKVRHIAPGNVVLDIDEDETPEQRAA
jgi:chromosome segregation ATPase